MYWWILFVASAGAIVLAGRKLSHYGDDIATQTGMGRVWIGAILLAGATSLPEVAASIAAAWQGAGNLAMGNVFGSNIFNIAILALAQLAAAKPILANVSPGHMPVAIAGMLLSGIAALAMIVRFPVTFLGAGLDAWLIAATYILVLRILPKGEDSPELAAGSEPVRSQSGSVTALWVKFGLACLVVVGAGYLLSSSADRIAAMTGLGQTFVGGTLLAAATSLPELTVTIVTARNGAYDLALGNVLGSNIFNMLILVMSDLAQPGPVPILSAASQGQIATAILGLILSGIAILGMVAPRKPGGRPFQWDMGTIAVTYVVGTWFLYYLR